MATQGSDTQPRGFEEITGQCPTCNAPTLFRRRIGNPWFCTVCGAHVEEWDYEPEHEPVEETLYCPRHAQ
jgi:ribosomal protein L37AE/L43A